MTLRRNRRDGNVLMIQPLYTLKHGMLDWNLLVETAKSFGFLTSLVLVMIGKHLQRFPSINSDNYCHCHQF